MGERPLVLAFSPAIASWAQGGKPGPAPSLALAPPATPPGPAHRDKDVDDRVGALVAAFAAKGPFSGVVVAAHEGRVIAARVAGAADVEHAAPMRLDTPMRLASVTKMLTAATVLALRDRGLVDLDAPVTRYLPDVPQAWSKVTVRQLLSHRTVLGEYTDTPAFESRRHRPATTADLWKLVLSVPPRGEADYCNSNYVVLGALIESVTGEGYDAAMQRLIFKPLGMADTAVDRGEALVPGRAVGYRWRGRLDHAEPFDPTNTGAGGSVRSTAVDLVRFAHALCRPALLKDESLRDMFGRPPDTYGLGCYIGAVGKHRLIGHGGGADGASTYLGVLPDADLCVVVLSNIEQTRTADLGRLVLRTCTGETVREDEIPEPVEYIPPPRAVTADELRRYAGEYQSELGVLKFAVEGDRLTLHAASDPKPEPLTPGDQPGTFLVVGPAQARLQFEGDGKQPSRTVKLTVRGKVVVGTRSN